MQKICPPSHAVFLPKFPKSLEMGDEKMKSHNSVANTFSKKLQ